MSTSHGKLTISLDENCNEPITGTLKESLETLRENNVPRYLFRAWGSKSGGGPELSTNSVDEIIPHGFMNGRRGHKFYEMLESEIKAMVYAHFGGKKDIPSEFSSWSASLLMVLFFAKLEENKGHEGMHIAVIDIHRLDGALVWHVPHLINDEHEQGIHEYLAHGPIRGPGYKAVSLEALRSSGLEFLFPELEDVVEDTMWGMENRIDIFEMCPKASHSSIERDTFQEIGALFKPLDLPVITALACARPRPWVYYGEPPRQIDTTVRSALERDAKYFESIFPGAADSPTAHWLRPGSVLTGPTPDGDDFPDIRQWIDLLRVMAEKSGEQKESGSGRVRAKKREEIDDEY